MVYLTGSECAPSYTCAISPLLNGNFTDNSAWGGPGHTVYPSASGGYAYIAGNPRGQPPIGDLLQTMSNLCIGASYSVTLGYEVTLLEGAGHGQFTIVTDAASTELIYSLDLPAVTSSYTPLPEPASFVATSSSMTVEFIIYMTLGSNLESYGMSLMDIAVTVDGDTTQYLESDSCTPPASSASSTTSSALSSSLSITTTSSMETTTTPTFNTTSSSISIDTKANATPLVSATTPISTSSNATTASSTPSSDILASSAFATNGTAHPTALSNVTLANSSSIVTTSYTNSSGTIASGHLITNTASLISSGTVFPTSIPSATVSSGITSSGTNASGTTSAGTTSSGHASSDSVGPVSSDTAFSDSVTASSNTASSSGITSSDKTPTGTISTGSTFTGIISSSSASSVRIPTATSTTKPRGLFCRSSNGNIILDENNVEYMVQCNTSYSGAIIVATIAKRQATAATSLADCFKYCDADAACMATAFNSSTDACILFSSVGASYTDDGIDFAVVNRLATAFTSFVSTASQTMTSDLYLTGITVVPSLESSSSTTTVTLVSSGTVSPVELSSEALDLTSALKAPVISTSTIYETEEYTISSCAPTVINCPYGSTVTNTFAVSTYIGLLAAAATSTTSLSLNLHTSIVYATQVYTISSCAPTVTDCPYGSVTTVITALTTTTGAVATAVTPAGPSITATMSTSAGAESAISAAANAIAPNSNPQPSENALTGKAVATSNSYSWLSTMGQASESNTADGSDIVNNNSYTSTLASAQQLSSKVVATSEIANSDTYASISTKHQQSASSTAKHSITVSTTSQNNPAVISGSEPSSDSSALVVISITASSSPSSSFASSSSVSVSATVTTSSLLSEGTATVSESSSPTDTASASLAHYTGAAAGKSSLGLSQVVISVIVILSRTILDW